MSSIIETFSIHQLECRKENLLKEIEKIENEIGKRNNFKDEVNLFSEKSSKKIKIILKKNKDSYDIEQINSSEKNISNSDEQSNNSEENISKIKIKIKIKK